jgi:hypothetical protein
MTSKMNNEILKNTVLLISYSVLLISCSSVNHLKSKDVITKACDLKTHLNDTIIIKGIYAKCVEYESFKLLKKDSCNDSFNMSLSFDLQSIEEKDLAELNKIGGCNQSVELCLKGIVRKEKQTYGHLGSNNSLFEVIEFIEIGKVKTSKL